MPGCSNGKKLTVSNAFEAVGAAGANNINEDEINSIEDYSCPGCGSCAGMFTANSMNCMTEVIGLGCPEMEQYPLLTLLVYALPRKLA